MRFLLVPILILFSALTALSAAPVLESATINAGASTLTLHFDSTVKFGAGGNTGFVITMTGGSVSVTYLSGEGTPDLVYTLAGRLAYNVETGTLAYTNPGNGVESDDDDTDLANITALTVTNSSTHAGVAVPVGSFSTIILGGLGLHTN